MRVPANIARATGEGAGSSAGRAELGSAMSLALALARARRQLQPDSAMVAGMVDTLWELAERYHPEQAWLAASWACGDRTLDDLGRRAPREALAPGLKSAVDHLLESAQNLRMGQGFAQK